MSQRGCVDIAFRKRNGKIRKRTISKRKEKKRETSNSNQVVTQVVTQPASSHTHSKGKGKATNSVATVKPKSTRYLAPIIEIISSSLDWSVTNTNFSFNSAFFELNNPQSWPDTTNHKNKVSPCPGTVSLPPEPSISLTECRCLFISLDTIKVNVLLFLASIHF